MGKKTVRRKKKKNQKNKQITFLIVISFACIAYLLFGYQHNTLNARQSKIEKLKSGIYEQQKINNNLKLKIQNVNSDDYIEETARELNMVKPGEVTFIDIANNKD